MRIRAALLTPALLPARRDAGNFGTYFSTDGTAAISATLTSSSSKESCSGGGKGGHITCDINFSGSFTGTLTANGLPQAINGITSNRTSYPPSQTCGSGTGQFYPSGIAVDSLGNIYVMDANNSRIVRLSDMNGTNWVSYGSAGSGVGQFAGLSAIAVDRGNHIYAADTGNRRIVRMNDMNGTNWIIRAGL